MPIGKWKASRTIKRTGEKGVQVDLLAAETETLELQ